MSTFALGSKKCNGNALCPISGMASTKPRPSKSLPSDLASMIIVKTWEGREYRFEATSGITALEVKTQIAISEGLEGQGQYLRIIDEAKMNQLSRERSRRRPSIIYTEVELNDDANLAEYVASKSDSPKLALEAKAFVGYGRGGVCPHFERSPSDFAQVDRSPWARHKYVDQFHLVALRVHGYSAIVAWILFFMVGLSTKGSAWHVVLGRLTAYANMPVSMISGLYLFGMLFHRSGDYTNIMKSEGPATIMIFSLEMILTWIEAFVVPTLRFHMDSSSLAATTLSMGMVSLHIVTLMAYFKVWHVLLSAIWKYKARPSRKLSSFFENAVELFVLVVPMALTNMFNLPVHLGLLAKAAPGWRWTLHHKGNALLLPYIAMPGTTLVIGRDAYWLFHKERIGTFGLHNLRDRLIVQNIFIVLYLVATCSPILSALLAIMFDAGLKTQEQ